MNSKKINTYIDYLAEQITQHKTINLKISNATIGWQIDHSLKVINNVCKALQSSDPKEYKDNFSFLGKLFFTLRYFPRGKAKAPNHVKPPEIILKENLISQIEEAKSNVETINSLVPNSYFKHPLFGNINRKRVFRFLELHTNHHIKIIDDILAK